MKQKQPKGVMKVVKSLDSASLWAKWDLPEAALGIKLAKNLALSQFGQALVN